MPAKGNITLDLNTEEWRRTVYSMMQERKLDQPAFLKWRASILVKDLILWTPPRGRHPKNEDWPSQKARGMATVAADVGRVFWKLWTWMPSALSGNASAQKEWKQAMNSGAVQTLQTMLEKFNVKTRGVITTPTDQLHRSAKILGHVPKNYEPGYHVIRAGGFRSFLKSVQSRVGEWKHGWMKCVDHLGVKGIPVWIKHQKSNPGMILDHSRDKNEPYFDVFNFAAGTAKGSLANIVGAAARINEVKLKIEWEKMLAHKFAKASAR